MSFDEPKCQMSPPSDTKLKIEIIRTAEDLGLVCKWGETIKSGDMYLAKRNGPVQLLTAKQVHPEGWINPVEDAYAFNIWDCCKVVEAAKVPDAAAE